MASKKKPESPWGAFLDIEETKFGTSSRHYLHFYKNDHTYSGMKKSCFALLSKEQVKQLIKYLKEVVKHID